MKEKNRSAGHRDSTNMRRDKTFYYCPQCQEALDFWDKIISSKKVIKFYCAECEENVEMDVPTRKSRAKGEINVTVT